MHWRHSCGVRVGLRVHHRSIALCGLCSFNQSPFAITLHARGSIRDELLTESRHVALSHGVSRSQLRVAPVTARDVKRRGARLGGPASRLFDEALVLDGVGRSRTESEGGMPPLRRPLGFPSLGDRGDLPPHRT
jgi:hypothetical protein